MRECIPVGSAGPLRSIQYHRPWYPSGLPLWDGTCRHCFAVTVVFPRGENPVSNAGELLFDILAIDLWLSRVVRFGVTSMPMTPKSIYPFHLGSCFSSTFQAQIKVLV